jgi:transcription termination factor Rho
MADITTDRSVLEAKLLPELQQIAQTLGVEGVQKLRKAGLIDAIVDRAGGNGASPSASANGGTRSERVRAARSAANVDGASPRETSTESSADSDGSAASESSEDATTSDTATTTAVVERERDDRNRGDRTDRGPRERNGGRDRADGRGDTRERDDRSGGRRRPSREERRRLREERRQREEQDRAEEMKTAPTQSGILDVLPEGYGFMRTSGYLPGPDDIYVSVGQVRKHSLRKGDVIEGKVRRPRESEKYVALLTVEAVNGVDPERAAQRRLFDKLTPLFPDERFRLEHGPQAIPERIIDMIAPVGKGQRGMVVSPPKAGKTTILKQIANGIISSNPETHVMVLLVDERPEEVTDWQRTVEAAEVVYSTFDKPTDQHIQVTELVLERAKRLAEQGQDVAIILDSLTRLARAYNLAMPASGKILTGGIDASALYPPRRFFGAARNIEEGGSVTIIASALVETGSRMDDGIFEEFKGTGNMELRLDRSLSEKRLFPAINVDASGTRKEELLLPPEELALVIKLRRVLHALEPGAALELLIDKLRATKSNEQFLKEIAKAPAGS